MRFALLFLCLLTLVSPALGDPMNKSPNGRFELILDTSSDHFMAKSKDWYVVDTKGERRTIATFSSSNGIYKVKFSPDGWSIIASNALGKVVEEIDLKKIAEDEGFSRTRRGVRGALVPSRMPIDTVRDVFEAIRKVAGDRVGKLELEVVQTNHILAEHSGGVVRVSTGLLNELSGRSESFAPAERAPFRARALGLILGHEVAHAAGTRDERLADAQALGFLECSGLDRPTAREISETLAVFDRPTGASIVGNLINRMWTLRRYGTVGGRAADLERSARGLPLPQGRRLRCALAGLRSRLLTRARGVGRGALGSEEAPRGLPLNPYYDWTPEAARRFTFAWKPENVRTQFDRARTGMIARLEERIAEAPPLRVCHKTTD